MLHWVSCPSMKPGQHSQVSMSPGVGKPNRAQNQHAGQERAFLRVEVPALLHGGPWKHSMSPLCPSQPGQASMEPASAGGPPAPASHSARHTQPRTLTSTHSCLQLGVSPPHLLERSSDRELPSTCLLPKVEAGSSQNQGHGISASLPPERQEPVC